MQGEIMPHTNPFASPEGSPSVEPGSYTVGTLGHVATASEVMPPNNAQTAGGIEELEAHANGMSPEGVADGIAQAEAHANIGSVEDNRVHDMEVAHEIALRENEIFNAHVAALQQNEIIDAYEAALKEDKERGVARTEDVDASSKVAEAQIDNNAQESQRADNTSISPAALRKEAVAALERAGLTSQIPPTSIITKDAQGNLLIMGDTEARIINSQYDGVPKITDYHYDKDKGTLTVSSDTVVVGRIATYEPTQAANWQTHKEVITLPPSIAKRFGIERAAIIKQ